MCCVDRVYQMSAACPTNCDIRAVELDPVVLELFQFQELLTRVRLYLLLQPANLHNNINRITLTGWWRTISKLVQHSFIGTSGQPDSFLCPHIVKCIEDLAGNHFILDGSSILYLCSWRRMSTFWHHDYEPNNSILSVLIILYVNPGTL